MARLAEIGGYLIWLWLREGFHMSHGLIASIILVIYGIIPAFQDFPAFGRVYPAYGGDFVVLSFLLGWIVDKKLRIFTTGLVRSFASLV